MPTELYYDDMPPEAAVGIEVAPPCKVTYVDKNHEIRTMPVGRGSHWMPRFEIPAPDEEREKLLLDALRREAPEATAIQVHRKDGRVVFMHAITIL